MDNIIPFPTDRQKKSLFDDEYRWEEEKRINVIIDDIVGEMFEALLENDFDMTGNEYMYYNSFLFESIKSLMYSTRQIYHPMQDLALTLYDSVQLTSEDQLEFDF